MEKFNPLVNNYQVQDSDSEEYFDTAKTDPLLPEK